MMHFVQPGHERPMRMPEHPMNDILDQRPGKQPSPENKRINQHRT